LAPLSSGFAPPEPAEEEPAKPALSQADSWPAPAAEAPAPAPESEIVTESLESAAGPAEEAEPVELPSFSDVTKTKIKPAPAREPDPDPDAEPAVLEKRPDIAPELELLPEEAQGRVKEPTGVLPVVSSE